MAFAGAEGWDVHGAWGRKQQATPNQRRGVVHGDFRWQPFCLFCWTSREFGSVGGYESGLLGVAPVWPTQRCVVGAAVAHKANQIVITMSVVAHRI